MTKHISVEVESGISSTILNTACLPFTTKTVRSASTEEVKPWSRRNVRMKNAVC